MLPTGTVIDGRYAVVREMSSSGGFGAVFEVKPVGDSGLPPAMALKCMKNPSASEADAERFRCEVEFLKKSKNDECFPRFFGEGELVGRFKDVHPYYVMELLEPLVAKGDVLYPEADDGTRVKCLLEVLEAVEVMHKAGYVHEDIKPANIMQRLGTRRHVLVDFGTVHKITGADDCNPGSPGYLAPEKGHGAGRDIFAIGQVIRDMFPEKVPIKWNLIINKCISRLPQYRYKSVDELRHDIVHVDELGREEMEERILEWRMDSVRQQKELACLPPEKFSWEMLACQLREKCSEGKDYHVGESELLIDFSLLGTKSIEVTDEMMVAGERTIVIKGPGVLRANLSPVRRERRVVVLMNHATLIDLSDKLPQTRDIVYCVGEHCYVNLKNVTKHVPIPETSYRLSSAGDSFIRCGGPDCVADIISHTDGVLWSSRPSVSDDELFGMGDYAGHKKGLTSQIWDAVSHDGKVAGEYLRAMGVQLATVTGQLESAFGRKALFAEGCNGQDGRCSCVCKVEACLPLGAIIGSVCGSWYTAHTEKDCSKIKLFHENARLPIDGDMTVAIAAALCGCWGDWDRLGDFAAKAMRIVGRANPFSFGTLFRDWMFDDDLGPYGSWGNGAAMRVSPCAWAARSLDEALKLARTVTGVTHNHPEGIKGAEAVTEAVFKAREMRAGRLMKNKAAILESAAARYEELRNPDFTIERIRPKYKFDDSCQGSVPQAIRAFYESVDFEHALRLAISLGGDSDTIASITGAIAEAYYGVPVTISDKLKLDETRVRILRCFARMCSTLGHSVEWQ